MKTIGIGLQKTGTSTLRECFEAFGLKQAGFNIEHQRLFNANDYAGLIDHATRHNALSDFPWALLYKELDKAFPGSKFILTTRKDSKTWIDSYLRWSRLKAPVAERIKVYGHDTPHGHEAAYVDFYERWNAGVLDYFKARPEDLLTVCWDKSASWQEICAFLGKEVPDEDFPHVNRTSDLENGAAGRFETRHRSPAQCPGDGIGTR